MKLFRGGLQKRLILSLSLLFCLPMLLICTYILSSMSAKLSENALSSAQAILDTVAQEYRYALSGAADTASLLAADPEMYSYLSRRQPDARTVQIVLNKLRPFRQQAMLQQRALRAMRIFHSNASLFDVRNELLCLPDREDLLSLLRGEEGNTQIYRVSFTGLRGAADDPERDVWHIDYALPPTWINAPQGIVEMVLDNQLLWDSVTGAFRESGVQLMLCEGQRIICCTTGSDYFTEAASAPDRSVVRFPACTLVFRPLGYSLRLCYPIPASRISLSFAQLAAVLLVFLAVLILTLLMIRTVCAKLLKGLRDLTVRIDDIAGRYEDEDGGETGTEDEAERLSRHFDAMVARLDRSFAREKQLLYGDLTNQLKPHFICNAMDMLRLQAEQLRQPQLAASASSINQYFRYAMTLSGPPVPLAEEIDNALNYLKLINGMRENPIETALSLDAWSEEHAGEIRIPKMLLLPLVENAVRHGVRTKKNAFIQLTVSREEEWLRIRLEDNGVGIDAETAARLNRILAAAPEEESAHVGLVNVARRLNLVYPGQYEAKITSALGHGTCVTLSLHCCA